MQEATPEPDTTYNSLLLQQKENMHAVIQDILNYRVECVKKTSVREMEPLLNLFLGSTPHKKKEMLIEFLRLMPEYRSTDQEVLYRRLKALKDDLKRTEGNSDLYFYAMRKYGKTTESESEILE